MIESYGKVQHFGTRHVRDILNAPVFVQEKVDGSQLSFGLVDGQLVIRSKNKQVHPECPDMFGAAVAALEARAHMLKPGWVYRGEYLSKPRHNVLSYDRVPKGHVALFDAYNTDTHEEMDPAWGLPQVAEALSLEAVPCLHCGPITEEEVRNLAKGDSFLGGPREGIVVKRYDLRDPDKPNTPLKAKIVTAMFKEKMTGRVQVSKGTVVEQVAAQFAVEARYRKAIQRLKEDGTFRDGVQDIGPAMKVLNEDLDAEYAEEIARALYLGLRKEITRRANAGFVDWYKSELGIS